MRLPSCKGPEGQVSGEIVLSEGFNGDQAASVSAK